MQGGKQRGQTAATGGGLQGYAGGHGGAVPSLLDATLPPSRSGPKAPRGGGGGGVLEGGGVQGGAMGGGGRSGGSVGGGGSRWGDLGSWGGGGGTGCRYLPLPSLWGES